ALSFDDHLSIADQNQLLDRFTFARDLRSRFESSPATDLDQLRQLLPRQTGKGTLAQEVQLLHVKQPTFVIDQGEYLIQVDDDKNGIPADACVHVTAGHSEIQNLKNKADDGHDAQPENSRHPIRKRDQDIRHMSRDIRPGNSPTVHVDLPKYYDGPQSLWTLAIRKPLMEI